MCGQPHVASLQVAGPNVLCQRVLQADGPFVPSFAEVCEQPPMASLQVVGPGVPGFAGVCEQPPAASLQVVGPYVQHRNL